MIGFPASKKHFVRFYDARKKWTQTMQRFAKGDRNAQQEISKQAQGTAGEGVSARAGMIWPWPRQKHDLDDDFSDFLDNSAWNLLNSAT